MSTSPRKVDLGAVAAMSWIGVAIGLSVTIGPQLGLRGWFWLGLHHLLCLVGSSHELWRAHKRALARAADQGEGP